MIDVGAEMEGRRRLTSVLWDPLSVKLWLSASSESENPHPSITSFAAVQTTALHTRRSDTAEAYNVNSVPFSVNLEPTNTPSELRLRS